MSLFDEDTQNHTIEKLHILYNEITNNQLEVGSSLSTNSTTRNSSNLSDSFMASIFGTPDEAEIIGLSEIEHYLDLRLTPTAEPAENPWQWWNARKKQFPILSKIAKKYLAIPATSVPSERLFSEAGNQISAKRTRLNSKIVGEMLFLKKNENYIDIFDYK